MIVECLCIYSSASLKTPLYHCCSLLFEPDTGLLFFCSIQCLTAEVGSKFSKLPIFMLTYKTLNKVDFDNADRSSSLVLLYCLVWDGIIRNLCAKSDFKVFYCRMDHGEKIPQCCPAEKFKMALLFKMASKTIKRSKKSILSPIDWNFVFVFLISSLINKKCEIARKPRDGADILYEVK